jgi:hypothetical protein
MIAHTGIFAGSNASFSVILVGIFQFSLVYVLSGFPASSGITHPSTSFLICTIETLLDWFQPSI